MFYVTRHSLVYKFSGFGRYTILGMGMAVSLLLTGCFTPRAYVDPTLPKIDIAQLQQPAVKQPVQVFFEFKTNEATNARVTEVVRPMILDTLKKSALFTDVVVAPVTADRKLFITVTNVANISDAKKSGVANGLTFGLAGATATDIYVMTASDIFPGKSEVKHTYKHAIYTAISNANGPVGLTPTSLNEALHEVIEGLTLNLLNDMAHNGELQ